jgi:cytochrome c-type biogenesis protein CcmF
MTGLLGSISVAVACALTLGGIVAAVRAARREDPASLRLAQRFAYACLALISVAVLAMIYALVTRDFSVSYVAQVGSRSTPTLYTIASLWGALEGSLLLWGWILALYTAAMAWRTPASVGIPLRGYALAVLLAIGTFFYYLLVGPATPFAVVSPVPLDGPGPNPLLQNHWLMAVHPPLLYLGYVGMSVPFAFAIGSLLANRTDAQWIRLTRRWVLLSWIFLSLAIVAGMWWAYEVLGWGGYWAWDPVENASLLPWLTATALLHSIMVQERRGILKVWNLNLVIATFLLTILGTFLTRSGIITSVHAFASGTIGYYFLAFLGGWAVFAIALLAGRSSDLQSEGRLDGVASRDTVFLINNLLLSAFTFTVLLGTMFPLVAEAFRGVRVSVGAPFFNRMTLPLCVALIFLMAVGPALPWRRASAEEVRSKLLLPALVMLLAIVAGLVLRVPDFLAVLTFAFALFALMTHAQEFAIGAGARMRAHGERAHVALGRLILGNRHRYGGYIAHLGVISLVVGVAASSTYAREYEVTLRPGVPATVAEYELRLDRLWGEEEARRFSVGADVSVLRAGALVSALSPRLNYYAGRDEPVPTPAVREAAVDLYLNLMAFEADGSSATVTFYVKPLVIFIWLGSLVMALGAALALWPNRPRRTTPRAPPAPAARTRGRRTEAVAAGGD